MDHIRDRGNIKWTAMMLPEHREMLRKLEDTGLDRENPELTEEKWEEINRFVMQAMNRNQNITLMIYQNLNIVRLTGKIKKYHSINRMLVVEENSGLRFIPLDCVIDAQPIDSIDWE